jgi:hypothetical protein
MNDGFDSEQHERIISSIEKLRIKLIEFETRLTKLYQPAFDGLIKALNKEKN